MEDEDEEEGEGGVEGEEVGAREVGVCRCVGGEEGEDERGVEPFGEEEEGEEEGQRGEVGPEGTVLDVRVVLRRRSSQE